MIEILNIQTYKDHGNRLNYSGGMRNERSFELFQDVFFEYGGEIFKGKIVGKELPPRDNPDYIYKVQLPSSIVERNKRLLASGEVAWQNEGSIDRTSLLCKDIFESLEQAKTEALKHLKHYYELNVSNVEQYFKQFKTID